MTDVRSTPELEAELERLRVRLADAEATLRAIHEGDVDAVVVKGRHGERVYTLQGADSIYRHIIETMSEGALTLSSEGIILYCNACLARMLGRSPETVVGTSLRDYLPPADRDALDALLPKSSAAVERREINLRTSEGGLVPVYLSVSRLEHREADLVFCLVLTDLTEQRAHEQVAAAAESLRASRQIIEGVLNAIPVRVFWKDLNGVFLGCNEMLARDAGFASPADIVGKNDFQMAWGAHAELYRADDRQVMESGNSKLLIEEPFTTQDGKAITLLTSKVPLRGPDGKVTGVLGTYMDITDRKRAEMQRERLAVMVEASPDFIGFADPKTTLVQYINRHGRKMCGIGEEEDLGGLKISDLHPPWMNKKLVEEILPAAVRDGLWEGRGAFQNRDGREIPVSMALMTRKGANGEVDIFYTVSRDISRDLALQSQFLQSQKMEGIGRLAGGIAHDFNNLLSVILGYTEMATEKLPSGDALLADLNEVKKAGDRAASLTRQLLAFSRKQVLQPEILDLNRVLTEVEQMLRRLIGEDIDFTLVRAVDLGLVKADPGQIAQVILNLVLNARDAMPGGGKLSLQTANVDLDEEYAARHPGVHAGPHVMLAVTDSGVGMDDQTKLKIFEPFFTTKPQGKGTGLGLSTVYGIVKQSGGSITFYSEVGQGTTFKVFLPRETSARVTPGTRTPKSPAKARGNETVLVVEDEEALRLVASRIVQAAGYSVLTAANGEEALLASAKHAGTIELLLTDVVMPGMNGRSLAQEISKSRPAIKVLYMSGYTDDAIIHHGVLEAGTYFIGKPFAANDLRRKVRDVLDA